MIRLKNVSKTYENKYVKTEVLDKIDFEIEDKKIIAITGPSGSGKSTLLNIMCGLDTPTEGQIFYGDVDIAKLARSKVAQFRLSNCGFVFQDFQLVSTLSVRDNIVIPALAKSKNIDEEWYKAIIKMTDITDKEDFFPHQLSGGEKQRVAIARAIITKPEVLFADEPTGNLDVDNTNRIMTFLKNYARDYGCTFIYVTHELDLCEGADVVIRVNNKKVELVGVENEK